MNHPVVNIVLLAAISLNEAYIVANFDPIPGSWDLDFLNETGIENHSPYDSDYSPGVHRSARTKRSTGTSLDAVVVNFTEVSKTSPSVSSVDIGDNFVYNVVFDLPSISVDNSTDLNAEFFAVSSTTGVGGYCICYARLDSQGGNIQSDPHIVKMTQSSQGANVRAVVTVPNLNTGGNGVVGAANLLTFQFQAVLCDLTEVTNGSIFYLTAGASYDDDAYVWVGQIQLTTNLLGKTYDSDVSFGAGAPSIMKKGDSAVVQINARTTVPSSPFILEVFQAQGYHDLFHIGEMSAVAGTSFTCADPNMWKNIKQLSSSGLSNVKNTLKYDFLVNTNGQRNLSDDGNLVTLQIPLSVMNLDSVPTGVTRDIAYVLTMGTAKLWTGIHTIKIIDHVDPGAGADVTISLAREMFNKTVGVVVGDSAVFQLLVSVPPGWANFNVKLEGTTGVWPVLARVIKYGVVAYIPPWFSVKQVQTDSTVLNINFGTIQNPGTAAANVTLEVAFMTFGNMTPAADIGVTCTIGTVVKALKFTAIANLVNVTTNTTAQIDVAPYEYPIDPSSILLGGQICLDFNVTVPSGASTADLVYEVVPDFTMSTINTRICRAEVTRVGGNLPCIEANANYHVETPVLNISEATKPLYDYAILDIGNACPSSAPSTTDGANMFQVTGCIELPLHQSDTSLVNLNVNFGLRQEASTIWVSSNMYPTNATTPYYKGTVVNGLSADLAIPYVFALEERTSIDNGGANQFMLFQSFQIDYLLKFHPQTFGTYNFNVSPPPKFRICQLTLTHIGRNFPCTKMPGSTVLPTDNVIITWTGAPNQCGSGVTMSFRSLTNWGRTPLVPDLIADDNSLMVTVWYMVCPNSAPGGSPIPFYLQYFEAGPNSVNGTTVVNVISSVAPVTSAPITAVTFESMIGPNTTIYRKISKILRFNLTIPNKFQNDVIFKATNLDFAAKKYVDFCNIQIVGNGDNVPCVSPNYTAITKSTPVPYLNGEVFEYMEMSAYKVCHIPYSPLSTDSLLTIDVAFRVKDDVPVDSTITMRIEVFAGLTVGFTHDYPFKVVEPENITLSKIDPNTVKVLTKTEFANGVPIRVGETAWIPFIVQLPPQIITLAEVSFLIPSNIDRPIMHAKDVRFDLCNGINVLCLNPDVNLKDTYTTQFSKSGNLRAFMSIDTLTTDLGYLVNAGFSDIWGSNLDTDNQFAISIQVQLSDAEVSTDNTILSYVYISIKFGDIIVVGAQSVVAVRNVLMNTRMCCERANIIVDFKQTKEKSYFYNQGEIVEFTSLIYHHNNQQPNLPGSKSLAEGWPLANLRILAPSFIKFVPGVNYVSSNYTNLNISNLTTVALELEFYNGILFPDIIELNFSLTMDPNNERRIGSGELMVSVVIVPVCQTALHHGFPSTLADSKSFIGCGSYVSESIGSVARDCFDPIPISTECQITASSMMDADSKPWFSIDPTKAWSPAVRGGGGWVEFLKFNFNGTARINWIDITSPADVLGNSRRKVTSVRIEASNNCDFFSYVYESAIPDSNRIQLPTAVEASNLKIIITGAESADAETKPIAINNVKFYGCQPYPGATACCPDKTIDATDLSSYRHFAVDTAKRIIYFCDYRSYQAGIYCYWTQRDPLNPNSNVWTELPRYVSSILGYSATEGKTYFKSRDGLSSLSTPNGKYVTLETGDLPADIVPGVSVPGAPSSAAEVLFTGTNYKGNYVGIWDGKILLAQWSPCCTP